jgi:hypothetical protein
LDNGEVVVLIDAASFSGRLTVLVDSLSAVTFRGKAALFGACGSALRPLLDEVERYTAGRWTFPDVTTALGVARDFATGVADEDEYDDLRRLLIEAAPHGHDLDAPWSTYAQAVLICVDAAVVASSRSAASEFKPSWIQYALEPLVSAEFAGAMNGSGREGHSRSPLTIAVDYLQGAVARLVGSGPLSSDEYAQLAEDALVIRPRLGS